MMRKPVVAIWDAAVQMFGPPYVVVAIGAALRTFVDEVNRDAEGNPLSAHPEDYEMHLLADFDEESGKFVEPEGGTRMLARGKDVRREES